MSLFNELVLISLKKQQAFSHTPSAEEWQLIHRESIKQAMLGFCFAGIELLSADQRPYKNLMINWFLQTEYIKHWNELMTERAAEVTRRFATGAFRSVVLKGQGIAMLYPDPSLRSCGDIDLWVEGNRRMVINFMKKNGWKIGPSYIHHTDVEVFPDVSVEVHHIPSYTYSPFRWLKYKKWFANQAKVQFQLFDKSVGFAFPSIGFNTVYSMLHIFRHVFHEGIGLRQLLDYYFILLHTDKSIRRESMETLRWMGLEEFVGAVMFVQREFFHIDEQYLLCEPRAKSGKFLLNEILQSGNFGKFDERVKDAHKGGEIRLYVLNLKRLMKMFEFYPAEVLWAPIWKILHQMWRWRKGY